MQDRLNACVVIMNTMRSLRLGIALPNCPTGSATTSAPDDLTGRRERLLSFPPGAGWS